MNNIKLKTWFINNNELCIPLMKFYVGIYITVKDNELCYELKVIDISGEGLKLHFDTIENAIGFTEEVISLSSDLDSIAIKYDSFYDGNIKKLERGKYGSKK